MDKQSIIIKFYRDVVFKQAIECGITISNIRCAVDKAYTDLNRPLSGIGEYKEELKNAKDYLVNCLNTYFTQEVKSKELFDNWHYQTCIELIKCFKGFTRKKNALFGFTIGSAQKWINMSFKYLYTFTLGSNKYDKYFEHCHMALDQFILAWFCNKVDKVIKLPKWSFIVDYSQYMNIQNQSRGYVQKNYPKATLFIKEFDFWTEGKSILNAK